jgi:hypothetical protein
MARRRGRASLLLVLAVTAMSGGCTSPSSPEPGAALAAGERLYRAGLLASGKPAAAVAADDVAMAGRQAACVSCHQRSGMGSSESWVVAPPVTKAALYAPVSARRRNRPAYTDETLARAVREGVDPAGQPLDRTMPRYDLPERDMTALIAYLKTLSAEVSPGVTEEVIHFATVVADGVDASTMLALLTGYFEEKNRGTRNETRRAKAGPSFMRNVNRAYRKWVLHTWTLQGAPDGWGAQLEAHYRAQPVFAVVSGMTGGPWQPVHEFCERNRIPCVLPNTDVPALANGDYYSVYFSQGLTLEAKAVAAHLERRDAAGRIVQLFRDDANGRTASDALRAALADNERVSVVDVPLGDGGTLAPDAVERALADGKPAAVVAWVSADGVAVLEPLLRRIADGPRAYLSATLLGRAVAAVPAAVRGRSFLAHPFSLPPDFRQRFRRAQVWLQRRGVTATDERLVAQTFFACLVVSDALMHITQDYFYRDYFLEFVDHLDTAARFSIAHPSPSFGPGQRYLSKGCYIVDLARDDRQAVRDAEWIVP